MTGSNNRSDDRPAPPRFGPWRAAIKTRRRRLRHPHACGIIPCIQIAAPHLPASPFPAFPFAANPPPAAAPRPVNP